MEPMRLPGNQCEVHAYHWPPVLETERHHVWPLGMQGPNVAANIVKVCGTGHATIHINMRALVKTGIAAPLVGTRKERALALRGYQAWIDAGQPGHPE